MTDRAAVLIADDHQLFAQGLEAGLAPHYHVVGIAATPVEVTEMTGLLEPDVLLLDVSLGQANGLKLIRPLRAAHPGLKIVVVTMHADAMLAQTALRAGAKGFVTKDAGLSELLAAIAAVLAGQRFVSPSVAAHSHEDTSALSILAGLTERQRQVVMMIGEGASSAAIAAKLKIAIPTVAFHRQRIRTALGLDSEWELTRFAILARSQAG